MKIVILDGYTENPGDLTVYDRTSLTDRAVISVRIGDVEAAVTNKTPIDKETIDTCSNLKFNKIRARVNGFGYDKNNGKTFFLDMGGSLEECKEILQEIKQRYDNLVELFQKPEFAVKR
jgi:hypothetical protein